MYVVVGASGRTGSQVASALLARREPVRVVVRTEEKARLWRDRGAEAAIASLDDRAAMREALSAARGLYYLVPPDLTHPDLKARSMQLVDILCDVADGAGLLSAVYLSSVGAHLPDGPLQMDYEAERRLREVETPFTFLRAPYFIDNTLGMLRSMEEQGVLRSFFTPERSSPMVAAKDIGEVAAQALVDPPPATRFVELTGPAEYSMNDVAEAYGRALGRFVTVTRVTEEGTVAAVKRAGFSADGVAFHLAMVRAFESGAVRFEGEPASVVRGKVTLEAFAKGAVAARRDD
jgi:uncharacterized protein YbjT (DUF2867 family)